MLRPRCGVLAAGLSLLDLGCAAIVDFPDDPQLVTEAELGSEPPRSCLFAAEGSAQANAESAHTPRRCSCIGSSRVALTIT